MRSMANVAKVEIYSSDMCPFCWRAKRLLESKGVDFIAHEVDAAPELRREMMERADGRYTVPQIFIDGVSVGGSDEIAALDAARRRASESLDDAGHRLQLPSCPTGRIRDLYGPSSAILGMSQAFRLACIQTNSGNDMAANIAASSDLVRAAHAEGAELIALPECVSMMEMGRANIIRAAAPEDSHPALLAYRTLAAELGVWLLAGSLSVATF